MSTDTSTQSIELGDRVACKVTDLVGIVIGITRFLYGCERVGIQASEVKDGQPAEPYWIDFP